MLTLENDDTIWAPEVAKTLRVVISLKIRQDLAYQ